MATLSAAEAAQVEAAHNSLRTPVDALSAEGRLKLFNEIIREYCTRCGKRQPDKDYCKCGLSG